LEKVKNEKLANLTKGSYLNTIANSANINTTIKDFYLRNYYRLFIINKRSFLVTLSALSLRFFYYAEILLRSKSVFPSDSSSQDNYDQLSSFRLELSEVGMEIVEYICLSINILQACLLL